MIKLPEASLLQCCGSTRWAREMAGHSFPNAKEVSATGDSVWWSLDREDWLEAFRAHPRIGDRSSNAATREEQAGTRHLPRERLEELLEANDLYEARFGYIFVVCAHGKSAADMLSLLHERMHNDPAAELRIAAEEQRQITHLRLKKLLAPYK
jgi:OHCU decarboxylase